MEEMVTISLKRYEQLFESEKILDALYEVGVDNWEGYEEAMKLIDDEMISQ